MTLLCPCCHETEANILVSVSDPQTFTCAECDESFTREDVDQLAAQLAKWTKVFAWAEKCPRDEPAVKIA